MDLPLVSVVTPFHDTAPYLAQCIESVLAQSYQQFEYILVDNCSTDGSAKIAETYACRDSRIRLIRRDMLLSQVENYNGALAAISAASKYCKIVQADDYIFPECLKLMVQAFEQSESIGLVSAYDLKADVVRGSRFPYRPSFLSGREVACLCLKDGVFPFGSPTTVMYRSSIVRGPEPFFDESLLHEDTEKCMQILEYWDFGFVYQVLSCLRVDNHSISAASRTYSADALDRYILVNRYAPLFLEPREAAALIRKTRVDYYRTLAGAAIRFREKAFWQYHRAGLKTLRQSLSWSYLAVMTARELLWLPANPGLTVKRVLGYAKRQRNAGPLGSTMPQGDAKG